MHPIQNIVLAALWAVAAWRLPSAVRGAKQRSVWIAFASLAAANTLTHPAVECPLNEVTGINNLATLARNLLGILGFSAFVQFVVSVARPRAIRSSRRLLTVCGFAGAFALVFLFAVAPRPRNVDDFFEAYTGRPLGTAYCCVFLGYVGFSTVIATCLFTGYSRHAGDPWLRAGLRLLGTGTALGALYALFCAARMLTRLAHQPFVPDDHTAVIVAHILQDTAMALIVIGNSIPACGVLRRTLGDRRTLRRLRPLWSALTEAVPDVVLEAPIPRWPRVRLLRQIIEIHDAILILACYIPPQLREQAHGRAAQVLQDEDGRTALAQALWLRAACEAKRAGTQPSAHSVEEPTAHPEHLAFDFAFEVARIQRLCDAYNSPTAEAFAREHRLEHA
ncbi:MAB_1171c family putative transporter [Streptomyces rimosus]|uniref:MAB_1171c family putative transporter n=1 Tax=Streptomyces rimosus TaxID=1927 RepID=UPI0004BF7CB1|nr:MAB_1171c family putative transporter [Streptomyces rimosus]